MSQQINLLNPRLRLIRDWLSLPLAVGVAVALIVVLGGVSVYSARQRDALIKEEASLAAANKNLLTEVESLGKVVTDRKPDAELVRQAQLLKSMLAPRQEVLQRLKNLSTQDTSFVPYLRGFSKQRLEGVWLTEFSLGKSEIAIRGRLTDPSLLPAYIRRLNSEPAFQGKRFAALDMKGVEPAPLTENVAAAAAPPGLSGAVAVASPSRNAPAGGNPVRVPYTEFVLQSTPVVSQTAGQPAPGGR